MGSRPDRLYGKKVGFVKTNRGGQGYIYTGGKEKLVTVGRDLGLEDELFEDTSAGPPDE